MVPEIALAKVNKAALLDKVCLMGCGVTTGIGAVLNTAEVEAGATVAVMAKASRIIAIDINTDRWAIAKALGATDFVNPKALTGSVTEAIVEMTGGGVGSLTTASPALPTSGSVSEVPRRRQ